MTERERGGVMTNNLIDETWKRLLLKVGETLSLESLEQFASSVHKVSTAIDSEGKLLLVLHGSSDSLDFIKPFFNPAIEFGFGGLVWQSINNESDCLIVVPPTNDQLMNL